MREIVITTEEEGQRVDSYLKKIFPSAPLSFFYKALRNKVIKGVHGKLEPDDRLVAGENLKCYLSDTDFADFSRSRTPQKTLHLDGQKFDPHWILFEDEKLLIVNKPAGITVHPGDHKTSEVSLIQKVQDYLGKKYDRPGFRPSLAHRLDRDTSGVLVIAKTPKTLAALMAAFRERTAKKQYLAICVGVPSEKSGNITAPLLRVEDAKNEAKVRIDSLGKPAKTGWTLLSSSSDQKFSLILCKPETGLTHQIRVHLASIGCPILGDKAYGDRLQNTHARSVGVVRQMLHAEKLSLSLEGKMYTWTAKIPPDFVNFLTKKEMPYV